MHSITVGFYGMTHLGLVSAVAAADTGHKVVCFDSDETLISQLKKKKYPIQEPGFLDCVSVNEDRLNYTAQLKCLLKAELIYVSIDVPTNADNQSDLQPIKKSLNQLQSHLREEQVVVVLSQVPPGFMRMLNFPPQQLFYQVETLVFGNAVQRAIHPERLIVWCFDSKSCLPSLLNDFLKSFNCSILTMCYESAELTKIYINMYLR